MTTAVKAAGTVPWWKEPTKDQWLAWWAAWLGWTLDAFDFTVFLLIMVAIAKEFNVPLTAVTVVFTVTLWMRLVGAVASGWLADRVGRKTPLMISILCSRVPLFVHAANRKIPILPVSCRSAMNFARESFSGESR